MERDGVGETTAMETGDGATNPCGKKAGERNGRGAGAGRRRAKGTGEEPEREEGGRPNGRAVDERGAVEGVHTCCILRCGQKTTEPEVTP
jgi:hypothetical protein